MTSAHKMELLPQSISKMRRTLTIAFIWSRKLIVLSAFLILFVGCASVPSVHRASSGSDESPRLRVDASEQFVKQGIELINQQNYSKASRVFNAGLKFFPTDSRLHFLNGFSYHLLYQSGDAESVKLAFAGYEMALVHDPAFYLAALQLGRLYFEVKKYDDSLKAFYRVLQIDKKNGDAYLGIASSAYYEHDLPLAISAAERAVDLLPKIPEAYRALALAHAANGDHAKAKLAYQDYAALEENLRKEKRLKLRLNQWDDWHLLKTASIEEAPGTIKDADEPTTANGNQQGADGDGASTDSYEPMSDFISSTRVPSPGSQRRPDRKQQKGDVRRAWYECYSDAQDPANANYQAQGGYYGTSSTGYGYDPYSDDGRVSPQPALPAPCYGEAKPRMVVLDVAFIRTEDVKSTSYGVNLLKTLSFSFGANRVRQEVESDNPLTPSGVTVTDNISFGTSGMEAGTLLAYSLNIANSTDTRSEVLAKPSLIALDRQPSTFFSGRNVTLGLNGSSANTYGYSGVSLQDRPIGVGLAVTPTFVDDDTVELAIHVQRSFIEAVDPSVKFEYSLQVSRSQSTANVILQMGQTLILSGMSEQEVERSSDGVPLLKDLPLIQYLFNRTTNQNYTSSVLVLITPRYPETDTELMNKTIDHIDSLPDKEKRKYKPMVEQTMDKIPGGMPDNLDGVYRHSYGNALFLQFRSGDLSQQHWSEPSRLKAFFEDIEAMLYY